MGDFSEISVNVPLEVCERRDPIGLYKKARAGEIRSFRGVDDPNESPESPQLTLDAGSALRNELAGEVIAILEKPGKI